MISVAAAEAERALQAPVEREVLVVLAIPVAAAVVAVQHARRGRDRLRRPPLHAHVDQELPRQLGVGEEVELVADVAIRRPVVQAQIVEVERAIGERIALVRVVVFVLREHVVRLELVVLREALPHAERGAAIERAAAAVRHEDVAQLRLERIGAGVGRRVARRRLDGRGRRAVHVVVQEPRQVRALRHGEVDVGRPRSAPARARSRR